MHHIYRRLALALVITCAVARVHGTTNAAAQQTLSSEMRLTWPGIDTVDAKLGPPPADFPREVLPRGTVPVASGVNGPRSIVVGTLSNNTPGWRTELLSLVSALGWTSQMSAQSGFVTGPLSNSVSICKDTDFVDVALTPATGGGTHVRAMLTRDPRRQCVSRSAGSTMSFADVTFPILEAPPGARLHSGGGGGSSSEWTSHAQLTTDLSMAALSDHYRRQIIDAGWTDDGAPAFFDNAMVMRFRAPSTTGPALPAMLIINAFDAHTFDAFLRLTRPPDR